MIPTDTPVPVWTAGAAVPRTGTEDGSPGAPQRLPSLLPQGEESLASPAALADVVRKEQAMDCEPWTGRSHPSTIQSNLYPSRSVWLPTGHNEAPKKTQIHPFQKMSP